MTRRAGLLLVVLAHPVLAATGPGGDGGVLARLPFGARPLALGGDHGTLPRDPVAFLGNPAALAGLDAPGVTAGLHQGPDEVAWNGLAGGLPILPWLAAGAVAESLTSGEIEAWDYTGARYTARLEDDRLLGAAVAARAGPVALGVGARWFGSTLLGKPSASALLLDLGLAVRFTGPPPADRPRGGPPVDWTAFSLAATGLGTSIDYGGGSDRPPLTWRLGLAAGRGIGASWRGVAAAAVDVPRATARPEAHGGVELAASAGPLDAALRLGARYRRDGGVLSAGAGLAWRGVGVDYAVLTADAPFGPTHHVSVTVDVGAFRAPTAPAAAE